jgi:hypothetical protein
MDSDFIARVDALFLMGWRVRVRRAGVGIVDRADWPAAAFVGEATHRWLDEPLERPAETADGAWLAMTEAAEARQRQWHQRRIIP